jgi:biopolymer transport protein ExbB
MMTAPCKAFALASLLLLLCALPQEARAWWNSDWSYRKPITLDGGATGGALSADIAQIPVLIRLHDGNFKFTDAKDDGTDLRFIAGDDKTPLKYHVEKYDSVFDIAVVWVNVSGLKAGASSDIWLYYGNPKATDGSTPKETFDSDQVLVYHFADKDGPARDSSAYANNALSPVGHEDASLIGSGAKFVAGNTGLSLPGSPSLTLAAGGGFTWSAWIKPDPSTPDSVLYARHDGAGSLVIGLTAGAPYVSVNGTAVTGTALKAGDWHFLAVSAADSTILYVDGKPVQTATTALPALATPATVGIDGTTGAYVGELDELRLSKIARPASFIAAEWSSEGPDGKLVRYGQDEQTSSWSSGYFAIILRSVTLDGWVIISVLIVMAVISWFVMVDRARYVGKVSRSNKAFLTAYRSAGQNLERFDRLLAGQDGKKLSKSELTLIRKSPLNRVLLAGKEEIDLRIAETGVSHLDELVLSAQTIEAIRAGVDAVVVQETHALNKLMILLTIAISGGPFIGLLGTVVGVMITFAAIAAAGDVNVNAIAPGIAAALVATCAGLFVAIPALFGYNYLLAKIRDATADIQVFADKFITRTAELYHAPRALKNLAAE